MEKPGSLAFAVEIFYQIFLLKFVSSNGLLSDKCVSSIEGIALLQHTYKSLVVRDMFACYYNCKDDELCQSLNFYRDNNLCELNNRTRSVRWSNSVSDSNAFYLDNPFRVFLGSSPILPAESCREIKNGSEGLAPSGRYWLGNQPVSAYCDMEREVIVECTGNPCTNGGSCDYQGEGQYKCRCLAGFTGIHCEQDIDECSSHPCLNGGKCTDNVNGFTCACAPLTTGMHCEHGIGPECNNNSINTESDRSVSYSGSSGAKCDQTIVAGWTRFNSSAGTKMPNYCVPKYKCKTHASGWLNGTHPTPQEGVVQRDVCFNWQNNCCKWRLAIKVRNCGLFYVYKLVQTTACSLRYCVTN